MDESDFMKWKIERIVMRIMKELKEKNVMAIVRAYAGKETTVHHYIHNQVFILLGQEFDNGEKRIRFLASYIDLKTKKFVNCQLVEIMGQEIRLEVI